MFVILDVVALPASCYNNGKVEVRFYLTEDFGELVMEMDVDPETWILSSSFPEVEREGYALEGWRDIRADILYVLDDQTMILAEGGYFQGNRNCMVFAAVWTEADASSTE